MTVKEQRMEGEQMKQKMPPIGFDNFEQVITGNYYYVDKTILIKQVLELKGAVNIFTRPRRFGKTLNLSMLRIFFEDTGSEEKNDEKRQLFRGLQIAGEKSLCADWMTKYPVISITLKSAKQRNFEMAFYHLRETIKAEYRRHMYVLDSKNIKEAEREYFQQMMDGKAPETAYYTALKFLTDILYAVTGRKTIILIDEYDVPLENAYFRGYYQEMTDFIRSLFESALKTNESMEFAVITGCLRISRESIFTGLNHLEMNTVLSHNYAQCFGFTLEEVGKMARAYGFEDKLCDFKKWYDGYQFGDVQIYNPWSILRYIKDLIVDRDAFPQAYWANTSSNEIVKNLVRNAGTEEKQQIECLIQGGTLEVTVHEEITYEDMNLKGDLLWNFLYFTGYLTKEASWMNGQGDIIVRLVIPNLEVKKVYEYTILAWFHEEMRRQDFHDLYRALENGDAAGVQSVLNEQLQRSISFYDSAENFYHGFLTGILNQSQSYRVKSNRESGSGRSDLLLCPLDLEKKAFVLELKTSAKFKDALEDAEKAVEQIRRMCYADELLEDGYEEVDVYGIAFYRKNCKVCYGGKY